MGDIRSITRNRKNKSDIVLKDGSTVSASGSNDVDGGNRGVMVENPEWGRVTVSWKRFTSITFIDGQGSGSGRDAFPAIAPLKGTVTGEEGETWTGRIVYDLDEAYNRDMFNGSLKGLDFDIPFELITTIEKRDEETCRVSLASGRTLDLNDSHDTGDSHAGLLVFENDGETPTYVPWSKVGVISFDHQ